MFCTKCILVLNLLYDNSLQVDSSAHQQREQTIHWVLITGTELLKAKSPEKLSLSVPDDAAQDSYIDIKISHFYIFCSAVVPVWCGLNLSFLCDREIIKRGKKHALKHGAPCTCTALE